MPRSRSRRPRARRQPTFRRLWRSSLLDSPLITNLRQAADATPVVESLQPDDDHAPASPLAAAKGSGTGLGFMIAGAAALVGGLLIGGTGGNLIAAGGVALGVYGIIVYF
jgi:hypothetical protein